MREGTKECYSRLAGVLAEPQLHSVPMPPPLSQAPRLSLLCIKGIKPLSVGSGEHLHLGYETRCCKEAERRKIVGGGGASGQE